MKINDVWVLILLCAPVTACKKDKTEKYYHGTWSVRERQYASVDTNQTDTLPEGEFTYTFKDGNSVHIVQTGIADVYDTWYLSDTAEDSIQFGSGITWAIQEKTTGRFKAKYYPTANAFFMLTLEK